MSRFNLINLKKNLYFDYFKLKIKLSTTKNIKFYPVNEFLELKNHPVYRNHITYYSFSCLLYTIIFTGRLKTMHQILREDTIYYSVGGNNEAEIRL